MSGNTERPGVSDDDVRLVARMAAGDRTALAELYDRHSPMLTSFAKRILGAPHEAADVLHDVFLEAWEQASAYDPERAPVRTWLAVRLRSRALDRLSSARARRTVQLDDAEGGRLDSLATTPAPESLGVRHALDRIPHDTREVLELTYFLGLTATEIAARLDVPIGTVKSRRARGLQLLEEVLTDGAINGD
jgi:RNA polymerase sigma-70 factor, ECF subfamily